MDYTNPQGVRFKITCNDYETYTVKYYTVHSKWPRHHRMYKCTSDAMRSEMFYILSNLRFCTDCQNELLGYRDERDTCKHCILRLAQGCPNPEVSECPVCYQPMLTVDNTKMNLVCRHAICTTCTHRLVRATTHVHYDQNGPYVLNKITCPLCRHVGYYDHALRAAATNSTI